MLSHFALHPINCIYPSDEFKWLALYPMSSCTCFLAAVIIATTLVVFVVSVELVKLMVL